MLADELKGELARILPARACCRRAELAGLVHAAGRRDVSTLDLATLRVARHLAASLGISLPPADLGTERGAGHGRHHLHLALDLPEITAWRWEAASAHDRRAFLRGLLLSASISFARSGPHVEFVLRDGVQARGLRAQLADVQVRAGLIRRRNRHVVYVKGQEEIANLLRLAGAGRALLDLEADRVARDVRNRLNRLLNAEEANLDRTVRAADRQLQAIRQLAAGGELERLSDGLRETARARALQPDADLDTLASSLGISRSAANHRLRRLVALAAGVRGDPS